MRCSALRRSRPRDVVKYVASVSVSVRTPACTVFSATLRVAAAYREVLQRGVFTASGRAGTLARGPPPVAFAFDEHQYEFSEAAFLLAFWSTLVITEVVVRFVQHRQPKMRV